MQNISLSVQNFPIFVNYILSGIFILSWPHQIAVILDAVITVTCSLFFLFIYYSTSDEGLHIGHLVLQPV